jgi:hypothetical protein
MDEANLRPTAVSDSRAPDTSERLLARLRTPLVRRQPAPGVLGPWISQVAGVERNAQKGGLLAALQFGDCV